MRRDYEDKALTGSGPARSGAGAPAPERPPAPSAHAAQTGVLPERPDAEYLLSPEEPPKRRKRRTWPTPS
jgi:hypothetical protein